MAWSEIYKIPFTTTPYQFNLHGLCDLQIGSSSTSMSVIKQRIKDIIEDPVDSGIIIPGDIEDEDRPSTRAMRKATFADREEVQYRDADKHIAWVDKVVIPLLLPLQQTKFGIMGVLAGHHFTKVSPVLNSVQYICQELSRLSKRPVPYLGEMSSFMDLRFIKGSTASVRKVIHVQHGEGGGQTKSASLNKLDRTSQGFIADAYIRAHDCQIVASKVDQLYPRELRDDDASPEMLHKTIAFMNLGAATRGYEMNKLSPSYIESKMMRPCALGWGTMKFKLTRAVRDEDKYANVKCDIRVEI